MSWSVRSKTESTSARLMMPTKRPFSSVTGSRLTRRSYMSFAACSTVSSGRTATTAVVIRSPAVIPRALAWSLRCRMPEIMPGSSSRASLVSMSASETTPITFWSSSTTGNALTRCSCRAVAISRNVASFLTQITRVVMISWTVVVFTCHSLPRVRTTLSAPVSAARANTSYASSKWSMSKWWVMNGLASSWPVLISRIRVGVEEVSTRPVVIVMSLIHCSSKCSVAASPCTPMFAIRPPGRARLTASSKEAGTPTASMATSAPKPPVRSLMAANASSRELFTTTWAPNCLAASSRASDRSMATMRLGAGDRGQADRAGPDDRDDVARADAPGQDPDLVAGRQDVGQHEDLLVAHAVGNPVRGGVGERHADVVGLSAVDRVAEDPAPAAQALPVTSFAAEPAGPAGADAGDQHPVTRPQPAHAVADLLDGPDRLVAEDPALRHRGHVSLEDVQVGPADRDRVDPDDHVAVVGDLGIRRLFPGLVAGTVVNESSHGCLHWLVMLHSQPAHQGRLTAGPKVRSGWVESHDPSP